MRWEHLHALGERVMWRLLLEGLEATAPLWCFASDGEGAQLEVRCPPHWDRRDLTCVIVEAVRAEGTPAYRIVGPGSDARLYELELYGARCRHRDGAQCVRGHDHAGPHEYRCGDRCCPGQVFPAAVRPHARCATERERHERSS